MAAAVPWGSARCAPQRGSGTGMGTEQRLGGGWHRVGPERSRWPWHKCGWEPHQIKPLLVSILMASSRAQSLVLLFKRTCLWQAGGPTRQHPLPPREVPSRVLRAAFLGRRFWDGGRRVAPAKLHSDSRTPRARSDPSEFCIKKHRF